MNNIQSIHCVIALVLILAAALGGILEPWAPRTRFPESWTPTGRTVLVKLTWGNRVITGAICGMIFLASACGFANSDLFTTTSLPSISISKIIFALVAGLVGVRLVRMKISVPFIALLSIILSIIDVVRSQRRISGSVDGREIKINKYGQSPFK